MNLSPDTQEIETQPQRQALRKKRRSMLDPYTEELVRMETEKKTIEEMLEWLAGQGLTTSATNVSQFLLLRREEAEWKGQQERLEVRADKCAAFEKWLAENPTPDLGAVIKMFQLLMMEMAAGQTMEPEVLKLADRLTRTALRFANDQGREAYRTRKLVMEEEKHREWVKCEQTRAFELCLDEAKKYPEVADMYRAAFYALEKRQKENGE